MLTTIEPSELDNIQPFVRRLVDFFLARGPIYVLYEEINNKPSRPLRLITDDDDILELITSMTSGVTYAVIGDRASYVLVPIAENELVLITGAGSLRPQLGPETKATDASHLYDKGDWFDDLENEVAEIR